MPIVTKSIRDRVVDAFEEADTGFGSTYLELVLERWCENARAMKRIGTLMVVLAVGVVLLSGAKTAEFSLGPFKLSNVASVLTIAPVILSFLLYEFMVLLAANLKYRTIVDELVGRLYPAVEENDLQRMLAPPTASLWGRELWREIREFDASQLSRLGSKLDLGVGITLLFGPILFLTYAFLALYGDAHANAIAVSAALLATSFNVARAICFMQDW